jgi:hypothetical protein
LITPSTASASAGVDRTPGLNDLGQTLGLYGLEIATNIAGPEWNAVELGHFPSKKPEAQHQQDYADQRFHAHPGDRST